MVMEANAVKLMPKQQQKKNDVKLFLYNFRNHCGETLLIFNN